MTKEQVIELAKQVGNCAFKTDGGLPYFSFTPDELERFATLVRNAALDEAAQKCEQDYRVQEARRAHADSMTLGGANHAYFNEVMARLTVTAQAIRNLKEPTP